MSIRFISIVLLTLSLSGCGVFHCGVAGNGGGSSSGGIGGCSAGSRF